MARDDFVVNLRVPVNSNNVLRAGDDPCFPRSFSSFIDCEIIAVNILIKKESAESVAVIIIADYA